jgi:periplasmic divalent cation tolerance protein
VEASLILCAVPSEEYAERLAQTLVEERLAACVSILAGARSIYRWEGQICDEPELLLLIKSRRELFPRLLERLGDLHPYEVPEVQALAVSEIAPGFLAWLEGATGEERAAEG